jgi:hypothetical protein
MSKPSVDMERVSPKPVVEKSTGFEDVTNVRGSLVERFQSVLVKFVWRMLVSQVWTHA